MHVFLLSVLITVSAQGRASAMPDVATESFTIATNAQNAASATSDNNARFERLMGALQSLGIARSDIRTTFYNVNYTPRPQAAMPVQPPERYGYFVSRGIEVTVHNLQTVGKAIDSAVASGVTDIGGVSFGVTDNRKIYTQALRSAVSDARARADAMAAAAGLHVVRVKSMQQGYAETPVPRLAMAAAMAAPAPPPPTAIEPSNVEVTAVVTITYEAQ
jgi:uncharacterized protein YggE